MYVAALDDVTRTGSGRALFVAGNRHEVLRSIGRAAASSHRCVAGGPRGTAAVTELRSRLAGIGADPEALAWLGVLAAPLADAVGTLGQLGERVVERVHAQDAVDDPRTWLAELAAVTAGTQAVVAVTAPPWHGLVRTEGGPAGGAAGAPRLSADLSATTVELLVRGGGLSSLPLLLVCGLADAPARRSAVGPAHPRPVRDAAALTGDGAADWWGVPRLTAAEVGERVERAPAELAEAVTRLARGDDATATHLWNHLVAQGVVADVGSGWSVRMDPARWAELWLRERIGALVGANPDRQRRASAALATGALLDRAFIGTVVAGVLAAAGHDPDGVIEDLDDLADEDRLDRLLDSDYLPPTSPGGPGRWRYRFVDPVTAALARTAVDTGAEHDDHAGRLLDALVTASVEPATVARVARAVGRPETAARHQRVADALAVLDRQYHRLLERAAGWWSGDDPTLVRRLHEAAAALIGAGRPGEAAPLLRLAIPLADRGAAPDGPASETLATLHHDLGVALLPAAPRRARAAFDDAVAAVSADRAGAVLVGALAGRAVASLRYGDGDAVHRDLDRSTALVLRLAPRGVGVATAAADLAAALVLAGRGDEARTVAAHGRAALDGSEPAAPAAVATDRLRSRLQAVLDRRLPPTGPGAGAVVTPPGGG